MEIRHFQISDHTTQGVLTIPHLILNAAEVMSSKVIFWGFSSTQYGSRISSLFCRQKRTRFETFRFFLELTRSNRLKPCTKRIDIAGKRDLALSFKDKITEMIVWWHHVFIPMVSEFHLVFRAVSTRITLIWHSTILITIIAKWSWYYNDNYVKRWWVDIVVSTFRDQIEILTVAMVLSVRLSVQIPHDRQIESGLTCAKNRLHVRRSFELFIRSGSVV